MVPPIPTADDKKVDQKVDHSNLPCPIPFEELHREAMMSLKPELFEGMRFDFTKILNQKFSLNHSVSMGPTEIPSQSAEVIKIPTANYEFGANFIDHPKLTSEPHMSQGMINFDYKGKDYRTQFQMGNGALLGASYIQEMEHVDEEVASLK
ncbi:mitochondrial import receptor subunit TOM40-1 isoform X6 [Medicago truncatula]|uniref:mitochondrial import receptor subunit TOM40-1 isoform X6 n=1 Tax=Medicago truncatula TaxID=3880 RepID=UPI0019673ABB|nr:mitochondrial import receptor subunit TOM40-1 isoform X6 [Medicago truncatula]